MDPGRVLGMTARLSQIGLQRTRSTLPRYIALHNFHTTSTDCDAQSGSSQSGAPPPIPEDTTAKIDDIFREALKDPGPTTSASTSRMGGFGGRSKAASTKTLGELSNLGGGVADGIFNFLQSGPSRISSAVGAEKPKPQAAIRLTPTTGRVVSVDNSRGMDVGRAFRQLDVVCNKNRVRNDLLKQRFHERPGLKRKRMRYERKLREFDANFKKVVSMVRSMAKQGW